MNSNRLKSVSDNETPKFLPGDRKALGVVANELTAGVRELLDRISKHLTEIVPCAMYMTWAGFLHGRKNCNLLRPSS